MNLRGDDLSARIVTDGVRATTQPIPLNQATVIMIEGVVRHLSAADQSIGRETLGLRAATVRTPLLNLPSSG